MFSNADGTIQFVELEEAGGGNSETGVSSGTISSNTKTFKWTSGAVTNTALKKYLIATPAFAALTGAPTPDAIISSCAPPCTPGPNIPFFSPSGDSVDFEVYDTCTFGPPSAFPPVPTNGKDSFDCLPNTTAVNSPTNYAGAAGSVRAAIATGNFDPFHERHAAELGRWHWVRWLAPDEPAERARRGERPLPAVDRHAAT